MSEQARRAWSAMFIVSGVLCATLLVAPAADALSVRARQPDLLAGAALGEALGGGNSVEDLFVRAGGRAFDAGCDAEYALEVLDPEAVGGYDIAQVGSTIGFTVSCDSLTAFARVADALEAKGWTCVSQTALDDAGGAETVNAGASSFEKREGAYRWACVLYQPVSGQTSIVVIAHA